MRKQFSVLALTMGCTALSASATEGKKDVSIACLILEDFSFYDVRGLKNAGADYEIEDPTKAKYYFNICAQTKDSCSNSTSSVFAFKKDAAGNC